MLGRAINKFLHLSLRKLFIAKTMAPRKYIMIQEILSSKAPLLFFFAFTVVQINKRKLCPSVRMFILYLERAIRYSHPISFLFLPSKDWSRKSHLVDRLLHGCSTLEVPQSLSYAPRTILVFCSTVTNTQLYSVSVKEPKNLRKTTKTARYFPVEREK